MAGRGFAEVWRINGGPHHEKGVEEKKKNTFRITIGEMIEKQDLPGLLKKAGELHGHFRSCRITRAAVEPEEPTGREYNLHPQAL